MTKKLIFASLVSGASSQDYQSLELVSYYKYYQSKLRSTRIQKSSQEELALAVDIFDESPEIYSD